MAAFNLAPGIFGAGGQFFGSVGANFPPNLPLNAGIINTFAAGTATPLATFANNLGSIQNSTSIVLGVDGRIPGEIWFPSGIAYKFQLTDSLGFQIQIWDNLVGVNDSSSIAASEWVASGAVPTFSNATTFTTPGNMTATFQVGRRVKATVTAGTVYGSVFSSSFGVSTTVVLTMDSGMTLDNGLSVVQVALLGEINPSVPASLPYALTATGFVGPLTGAVTGNVTGTLTGNATGTSTAIATSVTATTLGLDWKIDSGGQLLNNGNTQQVGAWYASADASAVTVVPFDTQIAQLGTNFSMSGTGTLTITATGWYRVSVHLPCDDPGNSNTTIKFWFAGTAANIYGPIASASGTPMQFVGAAGATAGFCSMSAKVQTTAASQTLNVTCSINMTNGTQRSKAGALFVIERTG